MTRVNSEAPIRVLSLLQWWISCAQAHEQAHGQCNAMVKGNGGAVGLASSPGALRRWVTAGPQIAPLLKSFDHSMASKSADCKAMRHKKEAGNSFEDDGRCLFALDSKVIVDAAAMTAVSSVITSGIQQYNNFVEERLERRTKPIKKRLQKNKLHVFVQQRKTQRSSLTILRNGCSLFSRLYIACLTRKGDLTDFFRHENQPTPQSLSKLGDMRTGKKANLQKCLERSSLGSGNAEEEEILVDETNNIDYEETVDPVTDDIAIEDLSDLSVELSLNLIRRKRNN